MRAAGVIPIDPLADRAPGFLKTAEIVLPNAFPLQAPKEAFYDAVLFRRSIFLPSSFFADLYFRITRTSLPRTDFRCPEPA